MLSNLFYRFIDGTERDEAEYFSAYNYRLWKKCRYFIVIRNASLDTYKNQIDW